MGINYDSTRREQGGLADTIREFREYIGEFGRALVDNGVIPLTEHPFAASEGQEHETPLGGVIRREFGVTQGDIAAVWGVSDATASRRLTHPENMEIEDAIDMLETVCRANSIAPTAHERLRNMADVLEPFTMDDRVEETRDATRRAAYIDAIERLVKLLDAESLERVYQSALGEANTQNAEHAHFVASMVDDLNNYLGGGVKSNVPPYDERVIEIQKDLEAGVELSRTIGRLKCSY